MTVEEIIALLITDRWQGDVDLRNDKGVYRAEDLNRVGGIVEYISNALQNLEQYLRDFAASNGVEWEDDFELGFEPEEAIVPAKTDWVMRDLQTKRQMRTYLNNIIKLSTLLGVDYSDLPPSMVNLTFSGANRIEKVVAKCITALGMIKRSKERLILGDTLPDGWLIYQPINQICYYSPGNIIYCVRK